MTATDPAIELRGISKSFGPVRANKDIDLRVIHLLGSLEHAGKRRRHLAFEVLRQDQRRKVHLLACLHSLVHAAP